jgi:hypothetical protein
MASLQASSMTARWRLAEHVAHDTRAFVQHLEPALAYFREHLSDEPTGFH